MVLSDKQFTFDRTVRLVLTVLVLLGLFALTKRLSGVLLPFLISWIVAYLLHPLVCFFQYRCRLKNRALSIAATLISLLVVVTGLLMLIIPLIGREVGEMSRIVSDYLATTASGGIIPQSVRDAFNQWLASIDVDTLWKNEDLRQAVKTVAPRLWSVLTSSLNFVAGLFVVVICFLYLIFILLDYEKLNASLPEFIPVRYRTGIMNLIHDLESGMNSYFRGQALIALIVGVLFAIGFSIMGMPMAIIMGLLIGVLNLVPYLQTVGLIPCVFLCILKSVETGQNVWIVLLEFFIVFLVVQSTQDMVLTPRIMGERMGLRPVLILLALSVWGSLLGLMGMIIALPMTTLMISYYKRFVIGNEQFTSPPNET